MNDDDKEMSDLVAGNATRFMASDRLRASIRAQIALTDAARSDPARAPVGQFLSLRNWRPNVSFARWKVPAVAFALGALSMAIAPTLWQRVAGGDAIEAELAMDHVHALKNGALYEIASSDRHTVKPWFQGRIDYAPPVFDLGEDGFPLVGGRVENVRGSPTATLVYQRNQHMIDVFVQPSSRHHVPSYSTNRGFGVVRWADGSMQYWAVSDADRDQLMRLASHWEARALAPK